MKPVRLAASPARMPAISRLLTRGTDATGASSAFAIGGGGTESSEARTSDDRSAPVLAGTALGFATESTLGDRGDGVGVEVSAFDAGFAPGSAFVVDFGSAFASSFGAGASPSLGGSSFGFRITKKPTTARSTTPRMMRRV